MSSQLIVQSNYIMYFHILCSFLTTFCSSFWKRVHNPKEIVNLQDLFVLTVGYVRAVGSFFMLGEGWVKMSAAMVGWRRKNKKKHWLKRSPKKTNFEQKYKLFKISFLEFEISFFENSISGIQSFYVCPDVLVDIIRDFFLISEFLAESLRTNIK